MALEKSVRDGEQRDEALQMELTEARRLMRELRDKLDVAEAEIGRLDLERLIALDRLAREHHRVNEALETIRNMERSKFWKLRLLCKRLLGQGPSSGA